ncbi:MAG: hypothetical protein NC200_08220 [Candidatus Gastranaerophilales bacterium]|nr:hypothetical protein [Candidatus Gastranaerophilales bacterium]
MKMFILLCLICISLPAFCVEQKYMPDGYVRDDVIHPYFVHYVSEYFKKVDSGQQECSWKTYRQQVEKPLSKDMDRLYLESIQGLCPRN